jgi:hypothetical protein
MECKWPVRGRVKDVDFFLKSKPEALSFIKKEMRITN